MMFTALMVVTFTVKTFAEDSAALDAAKEAVAEPVAVAEPASAPAPAAEPVASGPVSPSPDPVEPTILKELKDHTPIPIRSSLDQAIDTNGNRTLEYDEIKEYVKSVRASIAKSGKYPTNTDVLYHFDKNHDGYMDGGEISALESFIH